MGDQLKTVFNPFGGWGGTKFISGLPQFNAKVDFREISQVLMAKSRRKGISDTHGQEYQSPATGNPLRWFMSQCFHGPIYLYILEHVFL